MREAFRIAREERPGPVLLELPEDVAGEWTENYPVIPVHQIEIPVAHPVALDRAVPWRWRVHDEQSGDGDGDPARTQSRRADPGGQCLWHDPVEAVRCITSPISG